MCQHGVIGETHEFSEETGATWIPTYDDQKVCETFVIMYVGSSFNNYELPAPCDTVLRYRKLRVEMMYQATEKYEIMERVRCLILTERNGQL